MSDLKSRTTPQLCDDLWDAVLPAWGGLGLTFVAVLFGFAMYLDGYWWLTALSAIVTGWSVWIAVPWFQIHAELVERRTK